MKVTDLDPSRIPNHIAIILDGNGRWAKKEDCQEPMVIGRALLTYETLLYYVIR